MNLSDWIYRRRLHPPTYLWVVKCASKHPSSDKYWTGLHRATSRKTDNCWSLFPHRARRFQTEAMARYMTENSEACQGQVLYYITLD